MTRLARFPVSQTDIERVVAKFYARVRRDPDLGPVFQSHVTNWPEHEAKIVRFWCNAILYERSYDGNPMQVHTAAGNVHTAHFPIWLELFNEVLKEELSPENGLAWARLAHRIGRGLSLGVEPAPVPGGAPPLFS